MTFMLSSLCFDKSYTACLTVKSPPARSVSIKVGTKTLGDILLGLFMIELMQSSL